MTKRRALQVLIRTGTRNLPNEREREEVALAIIKLWPDAYGYDVTQSIFVNLGVPVPDSLRHTLGSNSRGRHHE